MALIKCSECGQEISDSAKMCPHCGYKTKCGEIETQGIFLNVGIIIHFSAVIIGIILFLSAAIQLMIMDTTLKDMLEDDSNNIFIIIRMAVGIGLVIAGFIHYRKTSERALQLKEQVMPLKEESPNTKNNDTALEVSDNFVKIKEIPEDKLYTGCFGKCEMCDARGATALCSIPQIPDRYELCADCINKYMAKIE